LGAFIPWGAKQCILDIKFPDFSPGEGLLENGPLAPPKGPAGPPWGWLKGTLRGRNPLIFGISPFN